MTVKELSQLYFLKKEFEELRRRIMELEETSTGSSIRITGMPRTYGKTDKVAKYAAEIVDLKSTLEEYLKKCFSELNRLNNYISNIDDSHIRVILTMRYINGLTWNQVAAKVGGGNSEDSVKKAAYRYLEKN